MPRTISVASLTLPLMAALVLPGAAVAGPPEGPSGRMALDDVADGLRKYGKEPDEVKRAAWLRRLAPSRDPRVAVELWEVFAGVRGKRTATIRKVARACLAECYVTKEGRPLSEVMPPDDELGSEVCAWWSRNGSDLRRQAKQLP
jgi:hypothetical protein